MKKYLLLIFAFFAGALSAQTAPTTATALTGQSATFTASVSAGTPPLVYVWKKDGVILPQNSASFTIPVLALSDAGLYVVTVSNNAGNTIASAQLTVIQVIAPAGSAVSVTIK